MQLEPESRSLATRHSWRTAWKLLSAPVTRKHDLGGRALVLNVLLVATLGVFVLAVLSLIASYVLLHNSFVLLRLGVFTALLAFVGFVYSLYRKRRYRLAATLLIGMYFMVACVMAFYWGVTVPVALLVFGLNIMLAGILIGARYSLLTAVASTVVLIGLQLAQTQGLIHPDQYWRTEPTYLGDILGFALVFMVMAVSSWLFNRQMERSLQRAWRAEVALTRQKALLELKVEQRTRALETARQDKMQQLYHFAELGQLSTALLHDMANHLTTLTLDMEDWRGQNNAPMVRRARRSIRYMDDMVRRVQDQLHGKSRVRRFSVAVEISQVVSILQHKAATKHITLEWSPSPPAKTWHARGDAVRFRQLVTNIASNAIDAYPTSPAQKSNETRRVAVGLESDKNRLNIVVQDWGVGIPKEEQSKIFEPFYSTKQTGMGIGLFIAKQIAEENFDGAITVRSSSGHTTVTITITKAS